MSPLYLIKLKIAQKQLTDYCSIQWNRLFQNCTESRLMFVFLPYLLKHSFSSLLTKNLLHSRWFYQKFIFKLNMVNVNM